MQGKKKVIQVINKEWRKKRKALLIKQSDPIQRHKHWNFSDWPVVLYLLATVIGPFFQIFLHLFLSILYF